MAAKFLLLLLASFVILETSYCHPLKKPSQKVEVLKENHQAKDGATLQKAKLHHEHQPEVGAKRLQEHVSGQRMGKKLSQIQPEAEQDKVSSLQSKELKADQLQDSQKITEVAFTSRYTGDYALFEPGTTLVFGTVASSVGSGYDASTGIFTCPVNGLYYFMVSALLREQDGNTDRGAVEIVVNGVVMAEVYFYDPGSGENAYTTGSNSAITPCLAGETVYVRVGTVRSMIGGTADIESTQFTGVLLSLL